jgi:UDP-glucose:(heptosyl)LPS alpha-1,3-glucosyltransferase
MERVLEELILGLRARGREVVVVARSCRLPSDPGLTFHRVRGPRRPLLIAHPWFLVAGSLLLARRRRGIVQTTGAIVLNRVDVISVHYCHRVGPTAPSRSTVLYRLHARIVHRLLRSAERACFTLQRAATIVCVSEGVADEVRAHYSRSAGRVTTIQNGVDTEHFAPGARKTAATALRESLSIPDSRLVMLFVGSEWGRKGLRFAIEALASAAGWDLVVAGSGESAPYEALAESLGVGQRVHLLGVWRDMGVVYELADAFVFPSSYEAFPLVTLEAAASGLPILATPINGIRELVHNCDEGFLIERTGESIATRLGQLAASPAMRDQMGRAARRAALNFTWARMVARHDELFTRLEGKGD